MSQLSLVVFDCDGTLVDSLHAIIHAMVTAFEGERMTPPGADAVRGIVGLSVPEAVAALAPGADAAQQLRLDHAFRAASIAYREAARGKDAPLYPGARAALERLEASGTLMAVATGKARRGLEHMLDTHDLRRHFVATQTADDAPSKPHPGMLENCERLTGAERAGIVMIGDTSFDITMAKNFGCAALGVSWGYHDVETLRRSGADLVIDDFSELDAALETLRRGM